MKSSCPFLFMYDSSTRNMGFKPTAVFLYDEEHGLIMQLKDVSNATIEYEDAAIGVPVKKKLTLHSVRDFVIMKPKPISIIEEDIIGIIDEMK